MRHEPAIPSEPGTLATDAGDDAPVSSAPPPLDNPGAPAAGVRGIRFGPFIFVPEWSAVPGPDPWAHRKGEPRMLTLVWTIFLLAASGLTLFGTRGAGLVRAVQYQTSARRLLLIVVFGAAVLWPMVRLCQQPPDRSIGKSILLDVLGVSAPVAAVLLPLPFLTGWSWSLLSMVWLVIAGWAMVTISIAHLGVRGRRRGDDRMEPSTLRRVLAMSVILAVVVGGALIGSRHLQPAASLAPSPMQREPIRWAASPLTHVTRLTTGASGLSPRVSEPDARAVVLLWVGGLGLAWWASTSSRR